MALDDAPLSAEERAELEELRAEKARREEELQARREREELARLKAERARSEQERTRLEQEAAEDRRIAELRARNARLMEPDEDLRMPLAQKLVLLGVALIAAVALFVTFFGK